MNTGKMSNPAAVFVSWEVLELDELFVFNDLFVWAVEFVVIKVEVIDVVYVLEELGVVVVLIELELVDVVEFPEMLKFGIESHQ